MQFPISTGRAALILGVTEPQLGDVIRRGKVHPAPPVVAGRRLWTRDHLRKAGDVLGVSAAQVSRAIENGRLRDQI